MIKFKTLSSEQIRQQVDTAQVYDVYRTSAKDYEQRFSGSMSWKKSTNDKTYLYKKTNGIWKSLGPKSAATELIHNQFHSGRDDFEGSYVAVGTAS